MKLILQAKNIIKKEPVMCIAFLLAFFSMFFVTPDLKYVSYIDFRTLCILFCLMTSVAGFKKCGVFDCIASGLLSFVKSKTGIFLVLILGCFFLSMIMTNDVALITFVPFAILTLKKAQLHSKMIFVIVMQTIAANLGSMLTPFGNPQNLFLYNLSQMSFLDFITLMLPLTAFSLVLIIASTLVFSRGSNGTTPKLDKAVITDKKRSVLYLLFFVFSLLFVTRIIDIDWAYYAGIGILFVLICDRKIFKEPDYCLLFTFVFFFVFIGNVSRIDFVNSFLSSAVKGNELFAGVAVSQIISNVPAAILLSAFSGDTNFLILGVNIGGLGTLIASMASLISYKMYAREYPHKKIKYLVVFTVFNAIFLALLITFQVIFNL